MVWSSLISAGGSLLGGLLNKSSSKKAFKRAAALQREFAQNSIQWRVEDAEKAGVHPLYALGAPTAPSSPTYAGDTSLGNAMANAGQDIGRAVQASSTAAQRDKAYTAQVQQLELTRMDLENELLKSNIAKARAQIGPPMPGAGEPLVVAGDKVHRNPAWSDADAITQRYGEPAEWLYSPLVVGADAWHNYGKKAYKGFWDTVWPGAYDAGRQLYREMFQ